MGVSYISFTFKKENIVILVTTIPNDVAIISLQHKNTVAPVQGTNTVHSEVDLIDELEPENS